MAFVAAVGPKSEVGGNENQKPTMTSEVMRKKVSAINASEIDLISRKIVMTVLNRLEERKVQVERGSELETLMLGAIESVKQEVQRSFSTPLNFVEGGLQFHLSYSQGFIADVAKKNQISISKYPILWDYLVSLSVDKELSNEKQDLSFVLEEISVGWNRVIGKEPFTIKEL